MNKAERNEVRNCLRQEPPDLRRALELVSGIAREDAEAAKTAEEAAQK